MKPKIKLFYDHDPNDHKRPVWLSIDLSHEAIPWTKNSIYIDISEYNPVDLYDFTDDVIGCSVYMEELLASPQEKSMLGLNLKAIQERLNAVGMDPTLIERFVVLVVDVIEVGAISKEMFL